MTTICVCLQTAVRSVYNTSSVSFAMLMFAANCTKVLSMSSTGFLKRDNVFLT